MEHSIVISGLQNVDIDVCVIFRVKVNMAAAWVWVIENAGIPGE